MPLWFISTPYGFMWHWDILSWWCLATLWRIIWWSPLCRKSPPLRAPPRLLGRLDAKRDLPSSGHGFRSLDFDGRTSGRPCGIVLGGTHSGVGRTYLLWYYQWFWGCPLQPWAPWSRSFSGALFLVRNDTVQGAIGTVASGPVLIYLWKECNHCTLYCRCTWWTQKHCCWGFTSVVLWLPSGPSLSFLYCVHRWTRSILQCYPGLLWSDWDNFLRRSDPSVVCMIWWTWVVEWMPASSSSDVSAALPDPFWYGTMVEEPS